MANYLLALGGTGAKILESFVHVSAAGVLDQQTRIVLLDQDGDNGNGARTKTLIALYEKLNEALTTQSRGGGGVRYPFLTKLTPAATLPLIPEPDNKPSLLDICRRDPKFSGAGSIEPHILDCLFSKDEQAKTLEYGFGGLPSLGSLVFAGQEYTDDWDGDPSHPQANTGSGAPDPRQSTAPLARDLQSLIDQIAQDADGGSRVRVFLVGSIYGGTGASAFPTVARLISRRLRGLPNVALGGVLCLPYFTFAKQPEEQKEHDPLVASSDRFVHQSIDTLPYYQRLLEQERGTFAALYLVGSKPLFPLNYFNSGGGGQANPPLLCELYAALFAQHFFSQQPERELTQHETKIHFVGSGCNAQGYPTVVEWSQLPAVGNALRSTLGSLVRFCAAYHFHYFPQLTGGSGDSSRPNRLLAPNANVQSHGFFKRLLAPLEPRCFDVLEKLDRYAVELLLYWGRMERHSYVGGVDGFPGIDLVATQSFIEVSNQGEIRLRNQMAADQMQTLLSGQVGRGDGGMNIIRTRLDEARPSEPRRPQPIDFVEKLYEACKV